MGQHQTRPSETQLEGSHGPKFPEKLTAIVKHSHHAQSPNEGSVAMGNIVVVEQTNGEWSLVSLIRPSVPCNSIHDGWIPTICLTDDLQYTSHIFSEAWYHGSISRLEAQKLLESGIAGSFLVRDSESIPGGYSVTLRANDTVYHYRISWENNYYFISPNCRHRNLLDLIQHHSQSSDGLVTLLKFPMSKKNRNYHFDCDKWEIRREDIRIQQRVGGGQYGDVYKAYVSSRDLIVAVKTLREDNEVCEDFMKEMEIMKKLKHRHLIQLIGVCSREIPYYLLTEFMTEGCLLEYIRKSDPQQIDNIQQLRFAIQICDAMRYLEVMNFIHRDLAARNCLVTKASESHQLIVKVADFGLSRVIETNEVYTAKQGGKFPIKWTAPEAIAYNRFSTKSDVWSFGILYWEISSFGMTPYPGIDISNVYEQLENGKRLERPNNCPRDCYAVMKSCWEWNENDRKKFSQIYDLLQRLLDRFVRECRTLNLAYQPQPPPMSFKNHPSMKKRPISTRPAPRDHHESHRVHLNRPNTALGHRDAEFIRNEPTRKSSGFMKMFIKSFGKEKKLKERKRIESERSAVEHSIPQIIRQDHPPDIWLSNIQKPIPRKPPRRTRSKSGSGSCSSPTPSHSFSSSNLPHVPCPVPPQPENMFQLSEHGSGGDSTLTPLSPKLTNEISNQFTNQFHKSISRHLKPQVPELTPTNSKENIFDGSSEASCDDFSSLHSTGNHVRKSRKSAIRSPIASPNLSTSRINSKALLSGFGSLHGARDTPNPLFISSGNDKDINQIINLQRQLYFGLMDKDGVRRAVVLQCGRPLCDLLNIQSHDLPASKKFKFSEKLSQMQTELGRLLSHQSHDGNRLATLSTDLVNILR